MDSQNAKHLLRKLPYEEGVDASVLFPPKAIARKKVRSLEELARVLEPNEKMIPSVRFERLIAWVKEQVGDAKLAQELEAIIQKESVYIRRCEWMSHAVQVRCQSLRIAIQEERDA